MAKHPGPSPYARLRQIPNDRRLHITDSGHTTSGYLAEASIQFTVSSDTPALHLELEESEHDLLTDGTDAARLDIHADRILAVDVDNLTVGPAASWAWQELKRILAGLGPSLRQGEMPPCEHEDVIEVPVLGDPSLPGICVWCPVPLVKLNDEWIPA